MNNFPIFAPTHGFIVVNGLSQRESMKVLRRFGPEVGRNQNEDGLADDLVLGVTVNLFGPFIPARDGSIQSCPENCVVGRFDDGSQFSNSFLSSLALGDVRAAANHSRRTTRFSAPRNGPGINPSPFAIPATDATLGVKWPPASGGSKKFPTVQFIVAGVNEFPPPLPSHVRERYFEVLEVSSVRELDAALIVCDPHHHGSIVCQFPKTLFPLPQRRGHRPAQPSHLHMRPD